MSQNNTSDKNAHKGSNQNDPQTNVTDNPERQQPEPENPVSQRRSETPSPEANVANVNNRPHGERPKISREGAEDHK